MILYDFMKIFANITEDTSDTVFDAVVTICWDRECDGLAKTDFYYDFCKTLYSKVFLKEVNENNVWLVDYTGLIKNNLDLFKDYSKKHWREEYSNIAEEDVDEFIYLWINELHLLLSGEITQGTALSIIKMLNMCEVKE